MFEQDNQLTGASRVGLTFCLHVGESLPAMLDDAANAELRMLREAMAGNAQLSGRFVHSYWRATAARRPRNQSVWRASERRLARKPVENRGAVMV